MSKRSRATQRSPLYWLNTTMMFVGMSASPIFAKDPAPPDKMEVFEVISVDAPSLAVGCSLVKLPFSGRVMFKAPGHERQPLQNAEFWAFEWGKRTKRLKATVDSEGRFQAEATGWDETFTSTSSSGRVSQTRSKARALVQIAAPGCEEKFVRVNRRLHKKTVVLKCHERR